MEPLSPILVACGVVLVLVTAYDLLKTVLTVSGGGPVTGRITARLWHLALRVSAGRGDPPSWLAAVGPALAVLTLLVWLAGLWVGWTLIFSASADAIVEAKSGSPATFLERAYYAGYTLTTLGPGDYAPTSSLWEITTVLTAVNGLFLFTMAITYIVPIIAATAQQRQLATLVNGLGDDPIDVLARSRHEGGFDALGEQLMSLTPMIAAIRQQHLAYPILHYFHSTERAAALPLQFAILDDTVSLLEHGVEPDLRPPRQLLGPLRAQLDGYLGTLQSSWIYPVDPPPPPPSLERCAEAGIRVGDAEAFAAKLDERGEHRSCLRALVRSDGWRWSHVGESEADD